MALATLNDLWYQWLSKATGNSTTVSNTSGAPADSSQVVNQYESISNAGTVTAPAANANVVSTVAAAAGYYQVDIVYGFGGTAETAADNNFKLVLNATTKATLFSAASVANSTWSQTLFFKATAGDVFRIQAVAAASAGAIYKAQLTITRLS